MTRMIAATGALLLLSATGASAQARVESNVVYGMYSGLALLMDVYHPASPNGAGVVYVRGSGFNRPLGLDAAPLKEGATARDFAQRLTGAGYTVFSLNHREAPRFQYPAAVEDVQRAVRYIRANASSFRVDPSRIGAAGESSGGHLVSMLGTLDGDGNPDDPDPVNRLSAKVPTVVALYTPFNLGVQFSHSGGVPEALFVGAWIQSNTSPGSIEYQRYAEASPITHVTPDDASFLLFHGDQDAVVSIEQSVAMEATLRKAGVEVRFVRVPGGQHARNFGFSEGDPRLPDYLGDVVRWMNDHLRKAN